MVIKIIRKLMNRRKTGLLNEFASVTLVIPEGKYTGFKYIFPEIVALSALFTKKGEYRIEELKEKETVKSIWINKF